jgi:DHA1 family bicyclomycin/chloramphenicol resistance-like MFS transporter
VTAPTVTSTSSPGAGPKTEIGFKQFVALVAAIMAVNALAIDSMMPALAAIGRDLGVVTENDRQWVITAYMLGFGAAQIVYGTLADRFGRKRILQISLVIYIIFSVASALAPTFSFLLAARALQGVGAAASRVLVVSIVRDRFSGRQMARVMSLALIVFLAVPILAPSIGQLILLVAPWRWIFGCLAFFGVVVMIWIGLRLPETLHAEDRLPMSMAAVAQAFRTTLSNRIAVGYMLATTLVFGGLFGFINSAQQVFVEVFNEPVYFTLNFAVIAGFMALASLINSRIVGKFGTRRVSHSALLAYTAVTIVHTVVVFAGHENLLTFTIFQSCLMFCFGMLAPNFGSMAMEPLGHVAGTASSVQGFCTTIGGALIGFFVGQHFDGTVKPLMLGFLGCAVAGVIAVLITEKGKLFQPTASGIATAS